ncbi:MULTISPECIES: hypothetical protein [Rhizobium]|nr:MULTISPECIES: hypothetical protein [Rhizobium]TCU37045.1 cytidine/deoxycytidylate deaminase-like protein [Rhizobium azibense]
MTYNKEFMARAVELSREALSKPGTEPFGAIVVLNGKIVGECLNHSLAHFDPTSHGEVEAFEGLTKRERHPIDVDKLRIAAGSLLSERTMPNEQHMDEEATKILKTWAEMKKVGK